jgi:hypothetical protein
MAPIHGRHVAERLWRENTWCRDFLPNARWRSDEGTDDSLPWILMAAKALGQAVLDIPVGTLIERWEQRRTTLHWHQSALEIDDPLPIRHIADILERGLPSR